VKDLVIRDASVKWDTVKEAYFTHGIETEHFDGLRVENFRGTASPAAAKALPIMVRDGKRFWTDTDTKLIKKEKVTQ
jgi:hypothetical protein